MFLQWLNDLVHYGIAKYAKTKNLFKYGKFEAKLLCLPCY